MGSESWVMCVLGDVQHMCRVGQKDLGLNPLEAVGSGNVSMTQVITGLFL